MTIGGIVRRYWLDALLVLAVAVPWLALLVLGMVWLWQGGHVWKWALAAVVLGLLTWPLLARRKRQRANAEARVALGDIAEELVASGDIAEARVALGDIAEPSPGWNAREREAWMQVLAIAIKTPPFSFAELDPLFDRARQTVDAVARSLHPEATSAWAQFSLPEVLLLTEHLCRDLRGKALHIPGIRWVRLSQLLLVHQQNERYGAAAHTGWKVGYGLWRVVRAVLNPLQAVVQEASGAIVEKTASVLSYQLRADATRMLVVAVGRAAIDLYSGRLVLSDEEVRAARARDTADAAAPVEPVRIVLMGQTSAGKSSLINALAQEIRSAVGPLPTTARAAEYRLELEGRPAALLVDMPGLDEGSAADVRAQAERADLMLWVASAIQPARGPDRAGLDQYRAWARAQLARRPPSVLLALTHIDQLRPAGEWAPPYDLGAPTGVKARAIRAAVEAWKSHKGWPKSDAKARAIRAAVEAAARTLDLPLDAVVPVAMPPGRAPYNLDALWARIALEVDGAKLVQLDRLRLSPQRLSLRELADQLGRTGRIVVKGIIEAR